MHSLYQRLKELDPDTFQRLCFHILKDRHPGLEVRHVEGASGDEGLDVFAGELSGKPAIWQCKSFRDGVGKSQKTQIRKSLRTALKHFTPSRWILCLSVGMDAKAHRWFERLKKTYESQVKIELLPNEEIVHELMYRRTLRNQFFPGAVIDITELKRLISGTGKMTLEELEKATDNNLEDIIERLTERDPRFKYQIIFDGDLGPPKSQHPVPAGLLMTISSGTKKLNVFERDIAALRSNPPTFSIEFKSTGIEKIVSLLNTGVAQEFTPDELGAMSTDFAFLSSATDFSGDKRLIVGPSPALTSRKRPVSVMFQRNGQTVQYGLMELRPIRAGAREGEFSLSGKQVPFTISFVSTLPPQRDVQATIHYESAGWEVRAIKKSLDALNLLRPSGELHIIDLETEKMFLSMTTDLPGESAKQAGLRRLVNELVEIADRFRVNLILPDKLVRKDYETIAFLNRYIDGGTEEVKNVSVVLTKSEENKDSLPELFASGGGVFRFTHPRISPPPTLFGTLIDTGPVMEEVEAEIKDISATLGSFREAAVGAGVKK